MTVEEAIVGRQSIRAFLPTPVPRDTIERILAIAGRAPSGSNIQPWKVTVLSGAALKALASELHSRHQAGEKGKWEYAYYSDLWKEPYLERRRRCGWGIYGTIGIAKGDRAATHAQQGRNLLFFDAPVGLIFTIDRDLAQGAWLDYGMFLQAIMVAARSFGLETCPQAAFCPWEHVIVPRLGLPKTDILVCGMSLGYADPAAVVNSFRTEREIVSEFTTFVDALPA